MKRPHRLIFYRDKQRKWRWRVLSPNGKNVANCGDGYTRRIDARTALYKMINEPLDIEIVR